MNVLAYTITAQTSGFAGAIQNAIAQVRALGEMKWHQRWGTMLGYVGDAAQTAFAKVRQTADAVGALTDVSNATGVAVDKLYVLGQAFEEAGVGAGAVGPTLGIMQKAIGGINEEGRPTAKIFGQLGLSVADLKKQAPDQQLQTIGSALMKISSPSERASAAMQIFGRSGAKMLSVFKSGGLDELEGVFGGVAVELGKNAPLLDQLSDRMGRLPKISNIFWQSLTVQVAPALLDIVKSMEKVNFNRWGTAIGEAVGVWLRAFSDGSVFELIGVSLKLQFANALDFLIGGFGKLIGRNLNLIDTAQIQKDFDALYDRLQAKNEKTRAEANADPSTGNGETTVSLKATKAAEATTSKMPDAGDRFSKMGLFASAGPLVDLQRRALTYAEKYATQQTRANQYLAKIAEMNLTPSWS